MTEPTERNDLDDDTGLPLHSVAGEGDYDVEPEMTDPLGDTVGPVQARLIYRMTMPNLVMRVLRFLLPHESHLIAPEATVKLLEDGIIDRVVLGEGKTYMLIYERLVALGVILDQNLQAEALAYLNNDDPLQVRIDRTMVEEEIRSASMLGVVITTVSFDQGLLFNFDEDSFLVHASLVARVRDGRGIIPRAVNFSYIYKCSDVGVHRHDLEKMRTVRSQALQASKQAVLETLRDHPRVYFGAFGADRREVITLIDVDIFRGTDHKNNVFV